MPSAGSLIRDTTQINSNQTTKFNQLLVFEETGKPEHPKKNPSEQGRQPANSAHMWRAVRESNSGHIGGKRTPSPLRQACSSILEDTHWWGRALSPLHQPCSSHIGRHTLVGGQRFYNCTNPALPILEDTHWWEASASTTAPTLLFHIGRHTLVGGERTHHCAKTRWRDDEISMRYFKINQNLCTYSLLPIVCSFCSCFFYVFLLHSP